MKWFTLAVLVAFILLAGIGAWRHRESIFDTLEFDSHQLFRKAKIVVIIVIALAFLMLFVINNWRLLIGLSRDAPAAIAHRPGFATPSASGV